MSPGGEGEGGKIGGDNGRMVTLAPLCSTLPIRDINDDTDISIRCDLSFILVSVIKLYFYNLSLYS